jgi:hypothetical protein
LHDFTSPEVRDALNIDIFLMHCSVYACSCQFHRESLWCECVRRTRFVCNLIDGPTDCPIVNNFDAPPAEAIAGLWARKNLDHLSGP